MPEIDYKELIASSYTTIAQTYHAWASPRPTSRRSDFITRLASHLPPKARVLELGCGAGQPATRQLVDLGFTVHGVDISSAMIGIARDSVPGATFSVYDMHAFLLAANESGEKWDCVTAFYSIWHLQPEQQEDLIRLMAECLTDNGWALWNMMAQEGELRMDKWMGAPMISWGLGTERNKLVLKDLVGKGLFTVKDDDLSTGYEGLIEGEMVGKTEQMMHWFCLQRGE